MFNQRRSSSAFLPLILTASQLLLIGCANSAQTAALHEFQEQSPKTSSRVNMTSTAIRAETIASLPKLETDFGMSFRAIYMRPLSDTYRGRSFSQAEDSRLWVVGFMPDDPLSMKDARSLYSRGSTAGHIYVDSAYKGRSLDNDPERFKSVPLFAIDVEGGIDSYWHEDEKLASATPHVAYGLQPVEAGSPFDPNKLIIQMDDHFDFHVFRRGGSVSLGDLGEVPVRASSVRIPSLEDLCIQHAIMKIAVPDRPKPLYFVDAAFPDRIAVFSDNAPNEMKSSSGVVEEASARGASIHSTFEFPIFIDPSIAERLMLSDSGLGIDSLGIFSTYRSWITDRCGDFDGWSEEEYRWVFRDCWLTTGRDKIYGLTKTGFMPVLELLVEFDSENE